MSSSTDAGQPQQAPPPRGRRARAAGRNPLPEGTLSIGAGLIVAGVASYAFLMLPARTGQLDAAQYAGLSALWFLVFTAGPGVFMPLEQETGRALSARLVQGLGGAPVVKRAALLGGALAAALVVVALALSPVLLDKLFNHQLGLLAGFLVALPAYAAMHLARGTLSGTRHFTAYGVLLGSEGILRLAAGAVLVVAGITYAGPYGLAMGLAPLAALVLVASRTRDVLQPGPEARWSELSKALGFLLSAQVLAQLLVNAAPIAAVVLASDGEREEAGRFGAGYLLARVPLFLFAAVQAALLPKLAGLAAAGRHDDFRTGLRRLLLVVVAVTVVATAVAFTLGPWAIRVAFGPDFELGRVNLAILAAASGFFMVATTLAQALIALEAYRRVVVGWAVGVVTFLVVVSFGNDLLLRVEMAFLWGSTASTLLMAGLLWQRMRAGRVPRELDPLLDAIEHEYVEP